MYFFSRAKSQAGPSKGVCKAAQSNLEAFLLTFHCFRYLSALEQRLHDAEALLGVIISSPDPRATTMVQDLSKDSLAAAIIARVTNSTFGPIGRNALQHRDSNTNTRRRSIDLRNQQMTEQETPVIDGNGIETFLSAPFPVCPNTYLGHLVFTTPSHTWQDYLNLRLSLESRIRNQDQLKPFSQDSLVAPQLSRNFLFQHTRIYSSNKHHRHPRDKITFAGYTLSLSSLFYYY